MPVNDIGNNDWNTFESQRGGSKNRVRITYRYCFRQKNHNAETITYINRVLKTKIYPVCALKMGTTALSLLLLHIFVHGTRVSDRISRPARRSARAIVIRVKTPGNKYPPPRKTGRSTK